MTQKRKESKDVLLQNVQIMNKLKQVDSMVHKVGKLEQAWHEKKRLKNLVTSPSQERVSAILKRHGSKKRFERSMANSKRDRFGDFSPLSSGAMNTSGFMPAVQR